MRNHASRKGKLKTKIEYQCQVLLSQGHNLVKVIRNVASKSGDSNIKKLL